ncbi:MAG: PHP domain-containing protein [Candidatus Aenigmatarchaeota archaeon]
MLSDIHIHSEYSEDSNSKIEDIIKIAKRRGLDAISITDHGTVEGSLRAAKIARGIKIIPGQEIKTKQGEILVYNLTHDVKENMDITKTCKKIKREGGQIFIPHPFDITRKSVNNKIASILNLIDGIESFNSRTPFPFNVKAQIYAKSYGIPASAGSDAHFISEIGKCAVKIYGNPSLSKIKIKRMCYSYSGRVCSTIYKFLKPI